VVTVNDVAAYILRQHGPMTAMKLQKLVYYSQAWHLVWDEEPLFDDRIEAWANGPVTPALYRQHRGLFTLQPGDDIEGNPDVLTRSERDTVEVVLKSYGYLTAHQLSELTHSEDPWRSARAGLPVGARGNVEISQAAMAEFYDGLTEDSASVSLSTEREQAEAGPGQAGPT